MIRQVHHLKEMTWQDVESLDRENTVVMIACGPIEQHGPQAPLSTDLYIAEHVMHRCAGHLADHGYPIIVAPSVPYVNALFSLPYPGSVSIRRSVVEEYLFDLLVSFAADGFRYLVLTSQHVDPPWVRTADSVCERVNEEYGARAIHGFERLVVDLVKKRLLKELPPQPTEFSEMKKAESFRELGNGLGYTGDLSQVTEEIGERIIEHYAGRFRALILRHVRGEDVYDLLRFSGF